MGVPPAPWMVVFGAVGRVTVVACARTVLAVLASAAAFRCGLTTPAVIPPAAATMVTRAAMASLVRHIPLPPARTAMARSWAPEDTGRTRMDGDRARRGDGSSTRGLVERRPSLLHFRREPLQPGAARFGGREM